LLPWIEAATDYRWPNVLQSEMGVSLKHLLLAAIAGALCIPAGTFAKTSAAGLDAALGRVEAAGFRGLVLVGDKKRTLWRGRTAGAPSFNAVWPWASVSKQLTSLLIMQEVQAGRLSLDDTLATRLPSFKGPNAGAITVRQLLQHTSGLPDPSATDPDETGWPSFYRSPMSDAVTTGFCAGTPLANPGAGFRYNNCDYLLLGAVLERATGKPFASLLRERIAHPAGARSVGVFAPGDGRQSSAVRGRKGKAILPVGDIATYGAGGAVYGQPADLLRIDQALLKGRLLGSDATTAKWTGDPKLGYAALGVWSFTAPLRGCSKPVRLIERRGAIGVQVRNILAPELGRAVVAVTDDAEFDFGEVWMGKGASYELLSAALCGSPG
jgi:CubicO group peptidase (beta-lactamase class C family)